MRLEQYDYGSNGAYFLTLCTHNRVPCLSRICVENTEPVIRLSVHGKIISEYIERIPAKYVNVRVEKYTVMPDHVHLLLVLDGTTGGSDTISRIMGWLKYQTTKLCNQAQGTQGRKLWQRSYYDHVIRNLEDYQESWKYIDNNPKAWALKHGLLHE